MRTKTAILILFLLCSHTLLAQNTAIGERAPRLRSFRPKIEMGKFLYVGFVYSQSHPCETSVQRAMNLVEQTEELTAVLFTREQKGKCKPWLANIAQSHNIVEMEANEIFKKYGVEYAPFGVILDHKRRVLWQGNPNMLDKKKIENIIQQWTLQR